LDKNKDIFGKAIKAYYENNDNTNIIVHSPDFDDDIIEVQYLFRSYDQMPEIEQKALELCKGKVLDVGCGAGSHALYLQNKRKLECLAIDTSPGAVEIARKRGLKDAQCEDFFNLNNQKFDTILLLMNGSGIIGELKNMNRFFKKAEDLLNKDGQIIMDSSDLIYLFEEDFSDTEPYYGELKFQTSYKGEKSDWFKWLYIDEELLKFYATKHGFNCNIIKKGKHFDYLAIINKA